MAEHRFKRLFLGNWMSFGATIFSMNNMTAFLTGFNGSGKSTVMDALALILFAESPNMLNYTGDQKRSDSGAIHWKTPNGPLRPAKTTSYIIMEAEDANGRVYHQGLRMVSAHEQAQVTRTFFQGEGTLEDIGAKDGNYDAVQRGTIIMQKTFRGKEEAFRNFFARRGFPLETFIRARFSKNRTAVTQYRDMNRSILSNTGISGKSLSAYAQDNIFPLASTSDSIQEMIDAKKRLDELLKIMKALEVKSRFLGEAVEKGSAYLVAKEMSESFERSAANINYDFYRTEVARLTRQEKEYQKLVSEKGKDAEQMGEKIKELTSMLTMLENEMTPVGKHMDELRILELELQTALNREKGHEEYLRARKELISQLPDGTAPEDAETAVSVLEGEREASYREYLKAKEAAEKVLERIDTLQSIIKGTYASGSKGSGRFEETLQSALLLKDRIKRELPEADPQLLYDCIERISVPDWQDAVERLLGRDRLGVIVSPEYYKRACTIQHNLRGNRQDVIVLNTSRRPEPETENTVPSVIVFTDVRARRYVSAAYGKYILCQTDEEYGNAVYALRKNGQTKVPNRSVLYGTQNKDTKILGKGALQREIENLCTESDSLNETEKECRKNYEKCSAQVRRLSEMITTYKNAAKRRDDHAGEDVLELKERIRSLEETIKELKDSDEMKERERKIESLRSQCQEAEEKQKEAYSEKGRFENRLEEVKKDVLENKNQLGKFADKKAQYGPLLEEDKHIIDSNKWSQALLGDANVNNARKQLKDNLAARKALIDGVFRSGWDILSSMPGAPISIDNENDLRWYEAEDEKILILRRDPKDREEMERLKDSMKAGFTGLLHGMYQDYSRAKDVHKKFNSFLPKYKIGICRYRLGAIRINNSNDAHLMKLAVKQDTGGQLTQADIDYIDSVFEDVLRDDDRNISSNPFDYQRYVTTCIEYQTDDMDAEKWMNADRTSQYNSNGQQAILRAIIKIVVLASQAFTENSLRICITDEVLQGVDDVNAAYFFDALEKMNIQCIFASMDERFAVYADDAFTFRMTQGKNVRVIRHGIRREAVGE